MMRLRLLPLVPTLAAALAAPAATAASALMVDDNSVRLSAGAELQLRGEHASATAPTSGSWDPVLAQAGEPDAFDFSIRRARIGLNGAYGSFWRFDVAIRADQVDTEGYQTRRGLELYKAWVERVFPEGDLTHTLHGGLDYAFFNRAASISPYYLLPEARPTVALMAPRGVGVRYLMSGQVFDFGVDLMNSLDPGRPAANAQHGDGLFYSARLEYSALDGPKPAYRESWAGEQGQGLLLALDVGLDHNDHGTPGVETNAVGYGIEAVGHFDQFSFLTELRFLRMRFASLVGGPETYRNQRVFCIQGGWAIPLSSQGMALEPAMRLSLIDFDTDNDHEVVPYDGGASNPGPDSEWGDSGRQIDFGLNLYFNGHGNKLQFSVAHWDAEAGNASATIIRIQQQLYF
jgi:hypothetical protein